MRPPIGFVIDRTGQLSLDPDAQIQDTVRLLFETFRRTGSAQKVVRHFAQETILWPRRLYTGGRAGQIVFAPLAHSRALGMLHNPRYAGAFVYGRTRQRKVILAGQTQSTPAARSGRSFCPMRTLATSRGTSTRRIRRQSSPMLPATAPIDAAVRRAKGSRSCKAW
jgi:Recombinase